MSLKSALHTDPPSQLWHLSHFQIRLTKIALLVSDVIAMGVAGVLSTFLAPVWVGVNPAEWMGTQDLQRYVAWVVLVFMGVAFFLGRFRHYTERKPFWTELGEVFWVLLITAVLDLALLAITRWNASRMWWLMVWPAAATFVPLGRVMARKLMRRFHLWQRPTLIVGDGPNAHEALEALQSEWALGFEVQGFVSVSTSQELGPLASVKLNGINWPVYSLNVLSQWVKVPGVQFVLAVEHGQNELRENVLRQLARWHAHDVCVIPAMRGIPLYGTDISYFYSHEVVLLKLRNNLRYWPARLLKRVFDILIAAFIFITLCPLFLYLVWAIRQDGGPAIFAHTRIGRDGKAFSCYKFRSMWVDAEKKLREVLAASPELQDEWAQACKLKHDPRITKIGHFLRRTSLDELPQLFNVFMGDMSLVGPRPVIRAELARYGEDVDYFLMVRPGMTGLWQVSGRNSIGYDYRVYLDTWYVKNWSLWYDIAILFKTARVVLRRDGAY